MMINPRAAISAQSSKRAPRSKLIRRSCTKNLPTVMANASNVNGKTSRFIAIIKNKSCGSVGFTLNRPLGFKPHEINSRAKKKAHCRFGRQVCHRSTNGTIQRKGIISRPQARAI